jgi:alpha-1,3-mannosyltransferase
MRVCHLVRQYAPSVGGLEIFVQTLASILAEFDCENEIITLDRLFSDPSRTLAPTETIDGVRVKRVPMIGHQRFFIPLIDEEMLRPYDILHVHGIDGMFDRVARKKRDARQASVATTHGLFFHTAWMAPVKTAYLHTATRLAASQYDLLIANSASDEARLRGVSDNVTKLANGVSPLGQFVAQGGDLLCLGRLARHKHVERIIAALAQPELTEARLHVVGPQWDVTELELAALAGRMGVAERVHLHGSVSRRDLCAIAKRCGLFVSASTYEGFGMALIEAMSVGLIPVVQANPSFVELIGAAQCGALVDFSSAEATARTIRHEMNQLSSARRREAIAFSAHFSWRGHAEKTFGLYRHALNQRAPARAS